jgi:hypothetical protein
LLRSKEKRDIDAECIEVREAGQLESGYVLIIE